jgi:hypothetical protein
MWNNLPITIANLDDPIGDPLTVPNYLLGKLAAEKVEVNQNRLQNLNIPNLAKVDKFLKLFQLP